MFIEESSWGDVPGILFVEPGVSGYSERALQLERSHYRVARAKTPSEIFQLRHQATFAVAVLSDPVGSFALRAIGRMVRGEWPNARILILGNASAEFEDHLYDDALPHAAGEVALLARVDALAEEYWDSRCETFVDWIKNLSRSARQARPWSPAESDPSKTPPRLFLTNDMRDWPKSVRRFHGPRLG